MLGANTKEIHMDTHVSHRPIPSVGIHMLDTLRYSYFELTHGRAYVTAVADSVVPRAVLVGLTTLCELHTSQVE